MSPNDLRARIRHRVGELCSTHDIRDDDDIFQLGLLNSLYALRLVQAVEREFDLTVSDDELRVANFRSVDAIAALVTRSLESR